MRHAVGVEEAQAEGQVEGERDERRVGRHLEHPVAVDGVVQPVHESRAEFSSCVGPYPYNPPLLACSLLASVTDFFLDPIVNAGTDFISSTGLPAVFILMALESACLPVPSEAIMLFAGSSVAAGELTMFGIVAAGVLGNLVGSWAAYAVGYYARLDLLEKNRLIHLPPQAT